MGGKEYTISITMNETIFKLMQELTVRLGYRNPGHTIETSLNFLELMFRVREKGLELGIADENSFYPLVFPIVKAATKDDVFLGQVIVCMRCKNEFSITEGLIYRQMPEHEGLRQVDCPNCEWTNDF